MTTQSKIAESKNYIEATNLKPKNEALIPTIVNILQKPNSKKNRDEAIDELYRLAKIADNLDDTKA